VNKTFFEQDRRFEIYQFVVWTTATMLKTLTTLYVSI